LPVGALVAVVADPRCRRTRWTRWSRLSRRASCRRPPPTPARTGATEGRCGRSAHPISQVRPERRCRPPPPRVRGDLGNWLFNHQALAEKHVVFALDLPGHGESSKDVGAGTLDELAAVAAAFLETSAWRAPTSSVTRWAARGVGDGLVRAGARPLPVARFQRRARPRDQRCLHRGLRARSEPQRSQALRGAALRRRKAVTRQLVDNLLKYKRLEGVDAALRKLVDNLFPGGTQGRLFTTCSRRRTFPRSSSGGRRIGSSRPPTRPVSRPA